jgi:hypothetical protein
MEPEETFEANSGRRMLERNNKLGLGSIQVHDDDDVVVMVMILHAFCIFMCKRAIPTGIHHHPCGL